MHVKVNVLPFQLVDCKDIITITIICDSELEIDVLQCKNVCDGLFIKPYLAIPFYINFVVSFYNYFILFNCRGLVFCTNSFYKLLVAEEVKCVFIVNQDHAYDI